MLAKKLEEQYRRLMTSYEELQSVYAEGKCFEEPERPEEPEDGMEDSICELYDECLCRYIKCVASLNTQRAQ